MPRTTKKTQLCPRCASNKPTSDFGPPGFRRNLCKQCSKPCFAKDSEEALSLGVVIECQGCHTDKPFSSFGSSRLYSTGLSRFNYCEECRARPELASGLKMNCSACSCLRPISDFPSMNANRCSIATHTRVKGSGSAEGSHMPSSSDTGSGSTPDATVPHGFSTPAPSLVLAELEAILGEARATPSLDASAQAAVVSQGLSVLAASGLMTDELYELQEAAVSMDMEKFQSQFAEVGTHSPALGAGTLKTLSSSSSSSSISCSSSSSLNDTPTPNSTSTPHTTATNSTYPSPSSDDSDSYSHSHPNHLEPCVLSSPHFCPPPSPNLASSSILSPSSLPPLFSPPPFSLPVARSTDHHPVSGVAIPVPGAVARAFLALFPFPFSPVCPNSGIASDALRKDKEPVLERGQGRGDCLLSPSALHQHQRTSSESERGKHGKDVDRAHHGMDWGKGLLVHDHDIVDVDKDLVPDHVMGMSHSMFLEAESVATMSPWAKSLHRLDGEYDCDVEEDEEEQDQVVKGSGGVRSYHHHDDHHHHHHHRGDRARDRHRGLSGDNARDFHDVDRVFELDDGNGDDGDDGKSFFDADRLLWDQ